MSEPSATHQQGARRHGADWINANQVAVEVLWGSKLNISDPAVKETIPLIILRVLDRLKTNHGFEWDGESKTWKDGHRSPICEPAVRDKLTWKVCGNVAEYRFRGILLENCLIKPDPHPMDHMITIVRRLRIFTGTDIGYLRAREIWDAKVAL